jgi:hypothetical protein
MNDAVYVSFTVYKGKEEGDWRDVVSALNHTEFSVDADGSYEREVCAVALPNPGVELEIETLDDPSTRAPFHPTRWRQSYVPRVASWTLRPSGVARGSLRSPLSGSRWCQTGSPVLSSGSFRRGGGADNAYCAGLFMLESDQALVIDARWPTCVYGNVMLWNRYMQGLDYRDRPASLNRTQVDADAEGRFRVVLAHQDPRMPNWLDTEGRSNGFIYWRFLLPEGEIDKPCCEVVPFAKLTS